MGKYYPLPPNKIAIISEHKKRKKVRENEKKEENIEVQIHNASSFVVGSFLLGIAPTHWFDASFTNTTFNIIQLSIEVQQMYNKKINKKSRGKFLLKCYFH